MTSIFFWILLKDVIRGFQKKPDFDSTSDVTFCRSFWYEGSNLRIGKRLSEPRHGHGGFKHYTHELYTLRYCISNMTSFIGYINYSMIKLTIYFNSHMCIAVTNKLQTSFLSKFMYLYRTMVHANIKMSILFFTYIFYRINTIDFNFDFF